ncbi:MAG: YciK family oxidoreductase [Gammaproteobacteria bacterium]|nr:YciK family oxidoreductase [Gammaproteobacteria bacterium]MDH5659945.1 YciK family oxidoreductase [Gammaproteobacteria bacterium]
MNEIIQIPANFKPQANCLKDKIILITGTGDGIGATAAKTFAKHGATVILLSKTEKKIIDVYDEIVNAGHPQPAIITLNLEKATAEDYAGLAHTIETEFGHLDGLLHNAAMFEGLSPISQFDNTLWERIVQVNLHAPFLLSQAMIPLLNKSKQASMVFTSSGVAHQGRAYWGAYGVTKAAGDNLMGILADELEIDTPIRVNSIDPGRVRTRMRALAFPGENPMTVPAPEDIMDSYLYLMSDESKDVNGKIISCKNS